MNNVHPILSVNELTITYKNGAGIRNINFDIYPGDFVALVGSNGAGKSTLLNGLSGIQEITGGTIIYDDHYIENNKPYRILGFSPQNQVIDWYLNVFDNVLLGPLLAGFDKKRSEEMALKALNKVNLQQKSKHMVDQLSGGQQQRVQIARAIAHEPILYVLDEPTTGLDAESSELFLQYLEESIHHRECAVIISSHDLNLLENYCNKMIYIENGEIVYFGLISEFVEMNNQTARFAIEYKGELNNALSKLESDDEINIIHTKPLVLDMNKKMRISNIISLIEHEVEIVNIHHEPVSLRETYLRLKSVKGEQINERK